MAYTQFTTQYTKLLIRLVQEREIMSSPQRLAQVLRDMADRIEASLPGPLIPSPAKQTIFQPFPEELNDESTAWLWLLENRPQIFQGIELRTEPYYHHIKAAQERRDAELVAAMDDPSQADVAQALFGDRTQTGGSYRRRILKAIKNATTTNPPATIQPKSKKAA